MSQDQRKSLDRLQEYIAKLKAKDPRQCPTIPNTEGVGEASRPDSAWIREKISGLQLDHTTLRDLVNYCEKAIPGKDRVQKLLEMASQGTVGHHAHVPPSSPAQHSDRSKLDLQKQHKEVSIELQKSKVNGFEAFMRKDWIQMEMYRSKVKTLQKVKATLEHQIK